MIRLQTCAPAAATQIHNLTGWEKHHLRDWHRAADSNAIRKAIDETGNAGDAGTADLFTAYSRALDKALWFLEAHVQPKE